MQNLNVKEETYQHSRQTGQYSWGYGYAVDGRISLCRSAIIYKGAFAMDVRCLEVGSCVVDTSVIAEAVVTFYKPGRGAWISMYYLPLLYYQ